MKYNKDQQQTNASRIALDKYFTIGNGGFFMSNKQELKDFINALKTATCYFKDEELFDDFWGIEDLDDTDIDNIKTGADFNFFNEIVIDMIRRLYLAVFDKQGRLK